MKFARWVVPVIGVVDVAAVLLLAFVIFDLYRSSMNEHCGPVVWESPFLLAFWGVWLAVSIAVAWRSGRMVWAGSRWMTMLVFVAASAAIWPAVWMIGRRVYVFCL